MTISRLERRAPQTALIAQGEAARLEKLDKRGPSVAASEDFAAYRRVLAERALREEIELIRWAAPAGEVTQTIRVDGRTYAVAPADALKLTGALWQVLSRREATVELASSQALVLNARNIDDVMQQLAGVAGDKEGA